MTMPVGGQAFAPGNQRLVGEEVIDELLPAHAGAWLLQSFDQIEERWTALQDLRNRTEAIEDAHFNASGVAAA